MSGALESHLSIHSVQKTIRCNSTSNAPDDGRMYPKHVELEYINKITLLHQVGISNYFMRKMYGQTTLNTLTCEEQLSCLKLSVPWSYLNVSMKIRYRKLSMG